MDSEIVDDCKDEIRRARRAAAKGVFIGATIAVAALFVPWTTLATGLSADALISLGAVVIGIVASLSGVWPEFWAAVMTTILHLQPWLSCESSMRPGTNVGWSICRRCWYGACFPAGFVSI